jgi:hypothetical protein
VTTNAVYIIAKEDSIMKQTCVTTAISLLLFLSCGLAFGAGAAVDDTLRLTLPGLEFQGQRYHLVLDYFSNPKDKSSIYWKYVSVRKSSMTPACGGTLKKNLNITDICILYAGMQLKISLDYYANPDDPGGIYWRLGTAALLPGRVEKVSGATLACFDPSTYMGIYSCIIACDSTDLACIAGCLPGGLFTLSVTVSNDGGSPVDFVIPAGMVLIPKDSGVQSMLVMQEVSRTIPAGDSKEFCIDTYCLDSGLKAPGETDTYTTGGVAAKGCLVEILNATAGVTITSEHTMRLQNIVWDCSRDGEISKEDRDYLEGL